MTSQARVAVIGRPNVGKSTLVNRLSGRGDAVTDSIAGVTRDRKAVQVEWAGQAFEVVDTGGWTVASGGIEAKVSAQAARAVKEADVVVVVVDATVGVTEEDEAAVKMVRRSGLPVIVVANKVDSAHHEASAWEAARLGGEGFYMVSALHGRGSGDLLDALVAQLPRDAETIQAAVGEEITAGAAEERVALVGRPNVGKSTLFNRLVGEERSVVHEEPGTTRDSIDTVVDVGGRKLRFVDTAGLRRRGHQAAGAEYYSLVRALEAIDRADVCLLLVDATEGITHQDMRLAERVDAAGCAVVIVLNKWELLDAEHRAQVTSEAAERLGFLAYAPVLKVSALTGRGVHRLIPAMEAAIEGYHRRVPTAILNKVVAEAQAASPAPRGARILYATQGAADPPTFTLFVNRALPPTYLRYLGKFFREALELGATPVKLRVRMRGGHGGGGARTGHGARSTAR